MGSTGDEAVELDIREVSFLSGSDVAPAERPAALDRLVKSIGECGVYGAAKTGARVTAMGQIAVTNWLAACSGQRPPNWVNGEIYG